jgi:hypothetical protein
MVNLDIFLWEETYMIYQKEKQSDSNRKFLWNWHHQNDSVFDKIFDMIGACVC